MNTITNPKLKLRVRNQYLNIYNVQVQIMLLIT